MEFRSGPEVSDADNTEDSLDAGLPTHERNLIDAGNHLVLSHHRARQWAFENAEHPASYVMIRSDLDDQGRVAALKRIESISLPEPLKSLLDAARYFDDCQADSQAAWELEQLAVEEGVAEPTESEIQAGLRIAFLNILRGYRNWGGYLFQGNSKPKHRADYPGPMIWSEQDVVFRFAKVLEREFPGRLHLGLQVSKRTSPEWDREVDRDHTVPITVAQAGLFGGSLDRKQFRKLRHSLFVGVKWLEKSRWSRTDQAIKQCREIQTTLDQLSASLGSGRCESAAMLVVDDDGFLDFHRDQITWPDGVTALIVSPSTIHHEGLGNGSMSPSLAEIARHHELRCPLCGEATATVS